MPQSAALPAILWVMETIEMLDGWVYLAGEFICDDCLDFMPSGCCHPPYEEECFCLNAFLNSHTWVRLKKSYGYLITRADFR